MKKSKELDAKFDKWLEDKISVLCFDHKNPFTDEEIKSWSQETAEWIIIVITPNKENSHNKHINICNKTINRIKDLHGLL